MGVMAGYKKTDVGVIPEEWGAEALKGRISISHGFPFASEHFTNHGPYRLTTPGHFYEGGGFREIGEKQKYYVGPVPSEYVLRPGELIVAMTEQADGLLGSAAVIPKAEGYLHNQRLGRVRVLSSELELGFLFYVFNSPYYRAKVRGTAAGTKVKHTSPEKLLEIPVGLPTPPEQRAIAEALSDVDALLGALDRVIAKKRDLKQAAMQQLLSGQIRLPGFHGGWENAQVQEVITGFFCGPSPTCEERNIQDESEWGVLKTTAVTKENGWDWTKHKTLPRVFWNKPHLEVRKGDVIVTKAGPRHRVGVAAWVDYAPPRIIVSGKMVGLRPHPGRVVPLMLAAAISAHDAQVFLEQRTTGMAESQVNFENNALMEAPIRIPCIEEQMAIAGVLADMDAELAALEQRRDKTLSLKQGMMQELLTGRVRLV
jgi:type I restriction enzyme S subunit